MCSCQDQHTHIFAETIINPTCTQEGYTEKVCSNCDYSEIIDYTSKIGHTYSDYIVDKYLTCIDTGLKHKKWTVCGYESEYEEIELLDHSYYDNYEYDEEYYWKYTLWGCNKESNKEEHLFNDIGLCEVCGYAKDAIIPYFDNLVNEEIAVFSKKVISSPINNYTEESVFNSSYINITESGVYKIESNIITLFNIDDSVENVVLINSTFNIYSNINIENANIIFIIVIYIHTQTIILLIQITML